MRRILALILMIPIASLGVACSEDKDSPTDGGVDAGDPEVIEDLPIDEEITLPALEAEVDVVVDNRGIPHIYAANTEDAMTVQGYLMARDRMAQMEFLRRAIEGRLAEVAGNLQPSMVDGDKNVRLLGFHRQSQATYDAMAADDPAKAALDAFAEGITAYIAEIKAGNASLPGNFLPGLLRGELLTDWTGVNTLSLARYQTYDLSFSAYDDVEWTTGAMGIAAAFDPNDADPRLAARAPMFHDLWPFAPSTDAFTQEGLIDLGVRSLRAPMPDGQAGKIVADLDQLKATRPFFKTLKWLRDLTAGEDRGSNSWIISGDHTASGHAIMCNDPHLSLGSPPVWWYNHVNTARAGGDWDAMGISFAGIAGITLGFNRDVSWGATVSNFDVTDVYQEVITPGENGGPDTVLFNGQQVPIEVITETIQVSGAPAVEIQIELVPHHGPIIPDTRTADSALSMKWTGFTPSNEFATFVGLNLASNVDDVKTAMENFETGGQNIVAADSAGDIFWTTRVHLPVRDPRAVSYDPATQTGFSPMLVLPGTGEYEWIDRVPDEDIPQIKNPPLGWLATANQDPVGTTGDGDPHNDEIFISGYFDIGHREARIQERLGALVAQGGITPDDMVLVQADSRSPMGMLLNASFVSALDRAIEEHGTGGTHPDLTAVVADAGVDGINALTNMRDRLAAWTSAETPAAAEDNPTAAEIADSVASSLFNTTMTRLTHLAFDDETALIDENPGSQHIARALITAIVAPDTMATYDANISDTVLWDDLNTAELETRDERIVRAALSALEWLETRFATDDMEQWRWGWLHTIRFEDMFGLAGMDPSLDVFSIPLFGDATYPDGFPRHGDMFVVDASNFSMWGETDYSYGSGPSQRLVAEMGPDGPRAWNSLPGGQHHDPEGIHHADEAELWRRNIQPELAYEELDVVQAAESRIKFTP